MSTIYQVDYVKKTYRKWKNFSIFGFCIAKAERRYFTVHVEILQSFSQNLDDFLIWIFYLVITKMKWTTIKCLGAILQVAYREIDAFFSILKMYLIWKAVCLEWAFK